MKRIIGKGHSQPANWNIYKHEARQGSNNFHLVFFGYDKSRVIAGRVLEGICGHLPDSAEVGVYYEDYAYRACEHPGRGHRPIHTLYPPEAVEQIGKRHAPGYGRNGCQEEAFHHAHALEKRLGKQNYSHENVAVSGDFQKARAHVHDHLRIAVAHESARQRSGKEYADEQEHRRVHRRKPKAVLKAELYAHLLSRAPVLRVVVGERVCVAAPGRLHERVQPGGVVHARHYVRAVSVHKPLDGKSARVYDHLLQTDGKTVSHAGGKQFSVKNPLFTAYMKYFHALFDVNRAHYHRKRLGGDCGNCRAAYPQRSIHNQDYVQKRV